jgi:hypothetical protein
MGVKKRKKGREAGTGIDPHREALVFKINIMRSYRFFFGKERSERDIS